MLEKHKGQPIGTLRETSLHAELKNWYAGPGDILEREIDGYIIDIIRGDYLLEIQTGNFANIKTKLNSLLLKYKVRIIHPVAQEKWIVRIGDNAAQISSRKSPKRGKPEDIFYYLVNIADLLTHPNLSFEIIMTKQNECWLNDGKGSWRRKGWSIIDRQLLEIVSSIRIESVKDFLVFMPTNLSHSFTNKELAATLKIPPRLAQKMTYCLRSAKLIHLVGKRGNAFLYEINQFED